MDGPAIAGDRGVYRKACGRGAMAWPGDRKACSHDAMAWPGDRFKYQPMPDGIDRVCCCEAIASHPQTDDPFLTAIAASPSLI